MKEIKLSSGSVLQITPSPFVDAKALYQAVLVEAKTVPFHSKMEISSLCKELFCVAFSSEVIERCLWTCFKRCTYNNGNGALVIDENTFEPVETRGDYMQVCVEVAKENIFPFMKSLYAEYQAILAKVEKDQA